ncbi:MAG: hypothetical protein AAGI09_15500 [Pseudomonadota bacterium]
MSETDNSPDRPEPAFVSDAALAAAVELADWCVERREAARKDARQQIRTVWWLLIGGVILLLALPRVVAEVDYTAATLPPDTVVQAEDALAQMVKDQEVMAAELKQAEEDLARVTGERDTANRDLGEAQAGFDRTFTDPLAVWEPIRPEGAAENIRFTVLRLITLPDGQIRAAGEEDTEEGTKTLILRSTDGLTWDPIRPEEKGTRVDGVLNYIAITPGGEILAAGREDTEQGTKTLILRTADGITWDALRYEADGSRVSGLHWTIHSGPDGSLYADGFGGARFVRAAPERSEEAASALLVGEALPDLIVPDGSAARAEAIPQLTRTAEIAQERVDQQTGVLANEKASHERRTEAVAQIKSASKELKNALLRTEPVRQASWIGTRLAVIALIIFLVQIVVNRYRYL